LNRIDASGLAKYDSLLTRAQDPEFIKQLTGMNLTSLEGFMLPETYVFDIKSPIDSLLSIPVREFFKMMKKYDINPKQIPNFYDKLILASIVEKESAHEDEREIIAGVYLNRLKKGMRLQSCPTVDYLLEPQGIKRKVLTGEDLAIPSPYNTYLNDGLPPTPICNPSLQAIQAVINPKPNDYLYFVSNREGRNDFSTTYQEHLRKKKIYETRD
ncbi:MAG TPA: endolytic transglycosylase MltG, partial [Candidatus Cloacimonadota bacterium]|nr:endolytic transglycosylase MltG [Candidatus Cloacimonadota bacterium]